MIDDALCQRVLGCAAESCGIIVVDHGSRVQHSNELLLEVVELFRGQAPFRIVEAAHMELAEPSIAQAFDRCVAAGAAAVVVVPFFLLPGRHWKNDIPALTAAAAAGHPGIAHLVSAPLGPHVLMGQIMLSRIEACLSHSAGDREACNLCSGSRECAVQRPV